MLFLVATIIMCGYIQTVNALSPTCTSVSDLIPDALACQRYINCSRESTYRYSRLFKYQEEECPYPQLFDITHNKCRPFQEANCGSGRVAGKSPCDYLANQCGGAHCEPCSSRLASCVGLPDGMHPRLYREEGPFFVECYKERTAGMRSCQYNPSATSPRLSAPVKTSCTTQVMVAPEQGGVSYICVDKPTGLYSVFGKPAASYRCPESDVYVCGGGLSFNETTQKCA